MANMSYCRFENTLHDLEDCKDDLDYRRTIYGKNEYGEMLSRTEVRAAIKIIELAREITHYFEDDDLEQEFEKWSDLKNEE